MLVYDILWSVPLPKALRQRIRHHIFMNASMPVEDGTITESSLGWLKTLVYDITWFTPMPAWLKRKLFWWAGNGAAGRG
jgi:hypothetical protein